MVTRPNSGAALARDARGLVEASLAGAGWRWSPRLSRWIDALVILEEPR